MGNENILEQIDEIMRPYLGDFGELSRTVGTYITARHYGWKALFLMQDQKTIKKHEKILGISFREALPEIGELANNSLAWRTVEKIGNFWKVVKSEISGRSRQIDHKS